LAGIATIVSSNAKKLTLLLFQANGVLSRASFSPSKQIRIQANNNRKLGRACGTQDSTLGGTTMRKVLLATGLGAMAVVAAGSAGANDGLNRLSQNPAQWAMPTGDYANTRYSKLKQINNSNVGKLQVAWTFSTGSSSTT
jgi:hypothetical protein